MKRLWPWIMLLSACQNEQSGKSTVSLDGVFHFKKELSKDSSGTNTATAAKLTSETEASAFMAVFELIDPGDFHVSSYHDYSYKTQGYRTFAGEPLASGQRRLFMGTGLQEYDEIYACQKFILDDSTVAVIVRHPGKSKKSSISLCLWDVKQRCFLPSSYLLSENNERKLTRSDTRILRRGREGRVYLLSHYVKCTEEGVPSQESHELYAIHERKFTKWRKKPEEF